MTTTEEARALARRFFEAWDAHDIDGAASLVAEDMVNHAAIPQAQGRAGFRVIGQKVIKAFPDVKHKLEDLIAEGDKIVMRVTVTGTHTGPLELVNFPLAATGKSFRTSHIHIFRVAGGKFVEHWAERDDVGMMKQLGALPLQTRSAS